MVTLQYAPIRDAQEYKLLREEKNIFNGLRNENYIEADIETRKLLNPDKPAEHIFSVQVSNYKQSNAVGMYNWVGNLHSLKKNIIVGLGNHGGLATINNIGMVQAEWQHIKATLPQRKQPEKIDAIIIAGVDEVLQDEARLANMLTYSYPYINLFPPIYNQALHTTEKLLGYRELTNVIHVRKVPIITEAHILKEPTKIDTDVEIMIRGSIDEAAFKEGQQQLTRMLRLLKNRPRVPTVARLQYMERYRINKQGMVTQGMCISQLEVPGSLFRYEKTIIKHLPNKEAAPEFKTPWMNKIINE
jgi:hypothetical protein